MKFYTWMAIPVALTTIISTTTLASDNNYFEVGVITEKPYSVSHDDSAEPYNQAKLYMDVIETLRNIPALQGKQTVHTKHFGTHWSKAMKDLEDENISALYGAWYSSERAQKFQYPKSPIYKVCSGVYAKKGNDIFKNISQTQMFDQKTQDELAASGTTYKICVPEGWATPGIDIKDFEVVTVETEEDMFSGVKDGKCDFFLGDGGKAIVNKEGYAGLESRGLAKLQGYVIFNKSVDKDVVNQFSEDWAPHVADLTDGKCG